ncbi:cation diffusion facilitator family transporter [bacterium]
MSGNTHHHKNPFSEKLFEYRSTEKKQLQLSLIITSVVLIVELIGGLLSGSIALISDAGHMFTHSFAIGISLVAIFIARKPLCHHRTFGLFRAEILAAFVNGLFLLIVAGFIVVEAVERILHPRAILGGQMLFIAILGLLTNVASIWILHGSHKKDVNIRSVFLHMIADAASSVGIIIAAIIILLTGWTILDPLVSIGISALILIWAYGILKESTVILLEMAPGGLNVHIISKDLKQTFPEIISMDSVHLWSITSDMLVFSAHATVRSELKNQNELIDKIGNFLTYKYHIIESTIQIDMEQTPGKKPGME